MMMNQTRGPLDDLLEADEAAGNDDGAALSEMLLERYGLRLSDAGVVRDEEDFDTFHCNMVDLCNDSLYYAATALAHGALRFGENGRYRPHHLDDSGDYDNAASDQIRWILETFQGAGDRAEFCDKVLKLLNATRDELDAEAGYPEGQGLGAYGFILGYADHFTPLSQLMLANSEDY